MYKHIPFILITFLSCCNFNSVKAQDSLLTFQNSIPLKADFISVNKIGELYFVDRLNQLKKFDINGDSVGVFNEVTKYGKLTYLDAQNPWKTLLFYKNYSTVVLLDKYLNAFASLNLRKLNIFPSAVTLAYDNGIWIFDQQDYRLKKLDESGNILTQTSDTRLALGNNLSIQNIVDRNNFIFLYDAALGLFQFDHYGTLKNKFAFLNWKAFEIINDEVIGFDDNYVYSFKLGTVNFNKYILPNRVKGFSSLVYGDKKFYFLVNGVINIYSSDLLKIGF